MGNYESLSIQLRYIWWNFPWNMGVWKDSANGDKFNSGGSIGIGVSAYFIINGASLSDYYYYNGVVGNMQATCYYDTSPILRWR